MKCFYPHQILSNNFLRPGHQRWLFLVWKNKSLEHTTDNHLIFLYKKGNFQRKTACFSKSPVEKILQNNKIKYRYVKFSQFTE